MILVQKIKEANDLLKNQGHKQCKIVYNICYNYLWFLFYLIFQIYKSYDYDNILLIKQLEI